MPRMLDLIRDSQVPSNLMQSAARDRFRAARRDDRNSRLSRASPGVWRAGSPHARSWDEKASLAAASNPATCTDVLTYFISLEICGPIYCPRCREFGGFGRVAERCRGARIAVRGGNAAGQRSHHEFAALLTALQSNPNLRPNELTDVGSRLAAMQSIADSGEKTQSADKEDAHSPRRKRFGSFLKETRRSGVGKTGHFSQSEQFMTMRHRGSRCGSCVAVTALLPDRKRPRSGTSTHTLTGKVLTGRLLRSPQLMQEAGRAGPRGEARQHAAENCQARCQRPDRTCGSRRQGRAVDSDPRRHKAGRAGSARVSEGQRWRSGGFALQKNVLEAVLRQIP